MDLYILRNEWSYDGYDFFEDLYYTTDESMARAELENRAYSVLGVELPHDEDSFELLTSDGTEKFYIVKAELDV
jgi:hypothetical protein